MEQQIEERRGPGRPRKNERNEDAPDRRRRIPLGTARLRLEGRVPDGMVGRWFNDSPGRIRAALDAGYVFIGESGTRLEGREGALSARVGVSEAGSPLTAYLMAIPREFYDEDQATKQRPVDELEATIRGGNVRQADPRDSKSFYTPNEGISIRHD